MFYTSCDEWCVLGDFSSGFGALRVKALSSSCNKTNKQTKKTLPFCLFHYSWSLSGHVNILLHLLSRLLWPLTFAFPVMLAVEEKLPSLCGWEHQWNVQCKYRSSSITAVSGRVMNLCTLRLLISIFFYSVQTDIIRGQASLQLGVCGSCCCHAVISSAVEDNKDSPSGRRGQRSERGQRGKSRRY